MRKKELAIQLLSKVEKLFPEATTELRNWNTPFQFLVCIVLSAQTTDRQVNKSSKELFHKFPNAKKLSLASQQELEHTLGGINYYKTKSRHIIAMAKILNEKYEGNPPKELGKLQELPGVGYKTANVFLNELYKANQGIAVDTHVMRVAQSYGLSKASNPKRVALDLEKIFPKKVWYKVNSTFVLYGRYILKAKKPDWDKVVLKKYLVKKIKP